ncbi:hypothetical protein NCC78_09535 [Micromonospora phytophila]|uniref:hypothetical protein n=1 Tax=Micromonospora phytophila TaxID=709888 RepID=UPI00202DF646|nr:hypothetical protein [Micromonospora phytophila]MCM0674930.1 hypothetical protein [Micromonospora phytophila]
MREDEIFRQKPCRIKGYDRYHTAERPTATIAQVYAQADAMPARFAALIIVAALSGLRWGKLAALRRCDVDLDAATVRVPRKLAALKDRLKFGPTTRSPPRSITGLPRGLGGRGAPGMRSQLPYCSGGLRLAYAALTIRPALSRRNQGLLSLTPALVQTRKPRSLRRTRTGSCHGQPLRSHSTFAVVRTSPREACHHFTPQIVSAGRPSGN